MRYEYELDHLPQGFALGARYKDEQLSIRTTDFLTDEDGPLFYQCLDHVNALKPFRQRGNPVSTIDHFLILTKKDKKAEVYINELSIIQKVIVARAVKLGESLSRSDILGVVELSFKDVSIPQDCGIEFFFSSGWRRGFFFDFRPLHSSQAKLVHIERHLAGYYERLLFNEVYSIQEKDWDRLYLIGWFPFVSILASGAFSRLLLRMIEGVSIEPAENEIIDSFDESRLNGLLMKFGRQSFLDNHIEFLDAGIQRYVAGDYLSAISNIWPRIEGILIYAFTGRKTRPKHNELVDDLRDVVANHLLAPSTFLPSKFRDYLFRYYFKNFDIPKNIRDPSRQSIAHGVSDSRKYDRKAALLGILIVDQLSTYLSQPRLETSEALKSE